MPRPVKRAILMVFRAVAPIIRTLRLDRPLKHLYEYAYWAQRKRIEGELSTAGFEECFTSLFGLTRQDYFGKRVLDIGCGPRGSLEWLDDATERVGLDPLAHRYEKLGISRHAMTYVNARSEAMPFAEGSFDVVASINSLDHVDDVDRSITEIKRVTAFRGLFLLMVDIHARPTIAEPHAVAWEVINCFAPEFEAVEVHNYESPGGPGAIPAVRRGISFDHSNPMRRDGVLVAKLVRVDTADRSLGAESLVGTHR